MSHTTQHHMVNISPRSINPTDALRVFLDLDTNLDGKLSVEELMGGLADCGSTEVDIEQVFLGLDIHKDGTISNEVWTDTWTH